MIGDKQIEEAARNCASLKLNRPKIAWVLQDIRDAFKEGANWMQGKIMSEAGEGFEEFFESQENHYSFKESEEIVKEFHFPFWQAAKLSSAKEIEQLKKRLEIAEKELAMWEKYAEDEGIIISAEKEQ